MAEIPTPHTYVEGIQEAGSMTLLLEGSVRCDMPMIMRSETKSPLKSLRFVAVYEDDTYDAYEYKVPYGG